MIARVLAVIVCLSVCHKPAQYTTMAKRSYVGSTPRDSPESLVFWRQKSLVGDPIPP